MNSKGAAAHCEVVLDAAVDIGAAAVLRERLLGALAAGEPVTIDASAAQQVDTAGLQVLCAFVRAAAATGLTVTWSAASPLLCERARLLGLDAVLGLSADTGVAA